MPDRDTARDSGRSPVASEDARGDAGSGADRQAPHSAPIAAWWQRVRRWLVGGDLPAMIAALDDEKLVRLRDGIYRNPRGLKGYHIRMVTSECARRGL